PTVTRLPAFAVAPVPTTRSVCEYGPLDVAGAAGFELLQPATASSASGGISRVSNVVTFIAAPGAGNRECILADGLTSTLRHRVIFRHGIGFTSALTKTEDVRSARNGFCTTRSSWPSSSSSLRDDPSR